MPADGIASSTVDEITACDAVFCTSTTGLCPETVIVSSSEPSRISALIAAVKFTGSSTPSRRTVLKPVSVNVTV